MDKESIEKYKLPCINCICLPICQNKKAREMFDQCKLIENYCEEYVDGSSNRAIAVDMMALTHMINETFNRYFVPCFMSSRNGGYGHIGVADIDPDYYVGNNNTRIKKTYLSFRDIFKIDMLDVPRIREFLLPIVREIDDEE
jgi:hypothetical protein